MKQRTLTKRRTELAADPVSSPLWTARRVGITAVVICLLVLAGLFGVLVFRDVDPVPPTFRRWTEAGIGDENTYLAYNSYCLSYHGDGLWFFAAGSKMGTQAPRGTFLFDLTAGEIVGYVVDGEGAVYDAETSSVLCYTYDWGNSSPVRSFARGVLDLAKTPSRSLFKLMGITAPTWLSASSSGSSMERLHFWMLDLSTDQATYLGPIMVRPHTSFSFEPSPDGRWTLIMDSRLAGATSGNPLVDMDMGIVRPFPAPGLPIGWWDAGSVLTWTRAEGIRLVDIEAGTHSLLIGTAAVTGLLIHAGIADPGIPHPFLSWNGRGYDLYFTAPVQHWESEKAYLVKYDRVEGRLELLSQAFQFDRLDREGRYYVFSDREEGGGSVPVFLHDLRTGEERSLVAPTPTGSHGFSIPVIRDQRIAYRRTNALRTTSIDETGHERLFPPP